jgi:hypothetical protein
MQLKALTTHATDWDPASIRPTLNVTLDASFVPSSSDGTIRLDFAHLIVLDNFISDQHRQELYDLITSRDVESIRETSKRGDSASWHGPTPPNEVWTKSTYDGTDLGGSAATWGLKHEALQALAASDSPALIELQSRLCLLYSDYDIFHMPSDQIQKGSADANAFVANAAVCGDMFHWHVDCDPAALPEGSPWSQEHGCYFNREEGKPYLVSLLVYLDREWQRDCDAETLFLDTSTDCGIVVRPKSGRAVLMDQDVIHRVSAPSSRAQRPRYSLVLKLVMMPKEKACCSLAREEWGLPNSFGSMSRAEAIISSLNKKRRIQVQEDGQASRMNRGIEENRGRSLLAQGKSGDDR